MNPGKPLHRREVEAKATLWRLRTPYVSTEHRLVGGGTQTFVDVFVDLQGYWIAVEIELSLRHSSENARRALEVGCDEIHLLFPTARLRDSARRKLTMHLSRGKLNRIAFLLLRSYRATTYRRTNGFPAGKCSVGKRGKLEIRRGMA